MASTARSRTGCDSCRRRKKKCDERKPNCTACVRLGIRCETTMPSFKFVGDKSSTFNVGSKHRVSRRAQASISPRPVERGEISDDYGSSEISSLSREDGNCAAVPERLSPNNSFIDGAEWSSQLGVSPLTPALEARRTESPSLSALSSPTISRGLLTAYVTNYQGMTPESIDSHHTLARSPESREAFPLSRPIVTSETDRSPSREAIGAFIHSLVDWFSSFVDMVPSIPTATSDDWSPIAEVDDTFYKLQEKLYLHHWRTNLLSILPTPFAEMENLSDSCPALHPAILSLSACHLAESRPDIRPWTTPGGAKHWLFSPNREHQHHGKTYYDHALHALAHLDYHKQDPTPLLATLLLFTLIESHIGSYRGAAFHHHGIEHVLSAHPDFSRRSALARDLARTWTALRAQNWRSRIPFAVPDFQRSLEGLGLDYGQLLNPSEALDEAVAVAMLQSWRLSLMVLFERYAGRGDMESISSRCIRDYYARVSVPGTAQPWQPKDLILDEDYAALLAEQRLHLEKWHAVLPSSYLPYENTDPETNTPNPLDLDQPPLRFHTHRAAINYAYYAAAQIFQSQDSLDEFLTPPHRSSPHPTRPEHQEAERYLPLLLRTIAGLDVATCAHHSAYGVGILDLLLLCQLRLPGCSELVRSAIRRVVTAYTERCITHEGSTLVASFVRDSEIVEEHRAKGRDLFYLIPRASPDWRRQVVCEDSAPYVAYGREREAGKFFCRVFPLTTGEGELGS